MIGSARHRYYVCLAIHLSRVPVKIYMKCIIQGRCYKLKPKGTCYEAQLVDLRTDTGVLVHPVLFLTCFFFSLSRALTFHHCTYSGCVVSSPGEFYNTGSIKLY